MAKQATTNEILEAINELSTHMDGELGTLKSDVGTLKSDVGTLKSDVGTLKSDVGTLKSDVGTLKSDVGTLKSDVEHIKANMVTKDYLDRKMADQKGELTVLIRKEDTKLKSVVTKLHDKKVLSASDRKNIFALEPFPEKI